MENKIANWFRNISIKNKLYYIAAIMFLLITVELLTLYTMVYLLSATRAYVGGEGLWSKAQKDATIYLLKYSRTRDETDYQKYLSFLNVILGDKKARLAMQESPPNKELATQGFIEGLNQPVDIPRMINLFLWFKNIYHLDKAVKIWDKADMQYIPKFMSIGKNLHEKILSGTLSTDEENNFKQQIYEINTELTELENNFSYALGDASRWLENIVLRAILTIAIIVEISGLLLTVLVTINIRKGIDEIIKVSDKVKQLDFSKRAIKFSNDEIGQLASAFNQMIDDLYKSIAIQKNEITVRKQQEQSLEVRYAITRLLVENFTLAKVVPKILKIMCETMELEYGGFWELDKTENSMYCVNVWSVDNDKIIEFSEFSKKLKLKYGQILPGKVWKSKKPCWIQDISKDSNITRLNLAINAGLHSAFALPILFEEEILGVLEFFSSDSRTINSNILNTMNDISNLMGIFIEREHAQKHVETLSRLAGMAEVASNVLHNVGNSLNSINTSVQLMMDKNSHTKMNTLSELNELLQQHKDDLDTFIAHDSKGKHIPQLISLLSVEHEKEQKYFTEELSLLNKNVSHVKDIISRQQSLSHTTQIVEEINLSVLLDDAIALNKFGSKKVPVEIIRDYELGQIVTIDKVKLMQIVVNLIKNGMESIYESNNDIKRLIIKSKELDNEFFSIEVKDTGVGILPENITKIFSYGFTTKKTGHGFGLHTSALYAEEMGGSLSASSEGIGLGATFTLILPFHHSRLSK